jgi:hypothetical protein
MPLLAAAPVMVSPEQREVLEQLVRTHSTPQQLALRARIMLLAADGVGVRESAEELDVWPKTVRRWRKRWRIAADGVSVKSRTLADDAEVFLNYRPARGQHAPHASGNAIWKNDVLCILPTHDFSHSLV